MKVLFLTNIPSPYRIDFFNELGKLCDLTVIFERRSTKARDESWLKHDFKNFNAVFLKSLRIKKEDGLSFGVIKWLRKNTFDIIVVGGYSTPAGMLAIQYLKLTKKPYFLNSDGGLIKSDRRLTYRIKRYFIKNASAYLSTSQKTNEYLIHYGAKPEAIHIYPFTSLRFKDLLPNPLTKQEKKRFKSDLELKYDWIILTVGQFIERKNFTLLLEAVKDFDQTVGFVFVGGEPTNEYLAIVKKHNLENVHFISFMSKEAISQYYKAADIFVLPTREDIWGLVINEALAHGLPVVTTKTCVAGVELIEEGVNGFLIHSDDKHLLVKHLNTLIHERDLFNLGKASLNKMFDYTLESMAKVHLDIFENWLSESKS